ncbi:MAG: 4a-hydroxytetrahydrobiopterin dehydratase [Acidobacteriota bacterium]|nr:4a-hydroxytetrahydrobiopterin dehydratase [Acidobacteriota bacterium]
MRFNKVTLRLTTHDADGVTKRDVDLAEAVQGLL